MTFSGERIRQAREIAGLTQIELAEAVGVNQSTIARLESDGFDEPENAYLQAIALRTTFPLTFFKQGRPPEFALGSLLFRKRKSLDRDDKARIRQTARLAFELVEKLARSRQPDIQVTRFSTKIDPVKAAIVTRDNLGLSPDTPVYRLMRTLEKNGVLVLSLPVAIPKYDAFSLWSDGEPRQPLIVLSANRPGDRVRFSLSHELAHLLMHHPVTIGSAVVEEEANHFAAEFLLPAEAMKRELLLPITLTHLAQLKARWGVSMQALIMRALALNLITVRQTKRLFMMLSAKGWRTAEPVSIPAEKPRRLRKLAEAIYGPAPEIQELASLVHAPAKLVRQIVDCHAGRDDFPPSSRTTPTPPPREPVSKVIDFQARRYGGRAK